MLEIRKQFRGDVYYPIDSAASEEQARTLCRRYVAANPDARLRVWDTVAKCWLWWYDEKG
jgi:hypothetical protein